MHANPSFQSQYLSVEKHTDHDRMVMIVITIRLDSDDHENDDNVGHKYIMSLASKDLRIISILRIIAIILSVFGVWGLRGMLRPDFRALGI